MRIEILGQKWSLYFKPKAIVDDKECAGYCDMGKRVMVIATNHPFLDEKHLTEYISRTYWHEILHAIFYESDLRDQRYWSDDVEHAIIAPIASVMAKLCPLNIKIVKSKKKAA